MKTLYVCSTYYHAYITLIKGILNQDKPDVLVTQYIADKDRLAAKMKATGMFGNVYAHPEVVDYLPKNRIDVLLFLHSKNREKIKSQLRIPIDSYEKLYLFHDDTWVSRYLKECKRVYHIIEDAQDVFKTIYETKFSYMLPKHDFKFKLKKALLYYYFFYTDWEYIDSIEVNSKEGLQLPVSDKIVVVPRSELINRLNDSDKKTIINVFFDGILTSQNNFKKKALLLTEPYATDGLSSEAEQLNYYTTIMRDAQIKGYDIYIKPHPRDYIDYTEAGVSILGKNMPVEVFDLLDESCNLSFDLGIGSNKVLLQTLDCIDEYLLIDPI